MGNLTSEKIYRDHHEKSRHHFSGVLNDERGQFIRQSIENGKKIIDLGSRDGSLLAHYADGNEVLAVDIDGVALEKCKDKLGVSIMKVNLNDDWPFEENSYDAVVAGEIIEHLYYPDLTIKKISKVLKNDGIFVGSTVNAFSLINRFRLLFGKKHGTSLEDPTHINHFLRKELEMLLKKYFNDVKIVPLGRFVFLDYVFPGLFSYVLLFEAKNKKLL